MTKTEPSDGCHSIWQRLILADAELLQAQDDLFIHCKRTLIELLRAGLNEPRERRVAFRIASLIPDVEQRKALFPTFLALACQPTYGPTIFAARDAILSFPHDWLLANMESEAGGLLDWDDAWEYRRFLELCSLIDSAMTVRIAQKATTHQNPEIRDAGEDFLNNPNPVAPLTKS
jgi:hypothetical protein